MLPLSNESRIELDVVVQGQTCLKGLDVPCNGTETFPLFGHVNCCLIRTVPEGRFYLVAGNPDEVQEALRD